LIVAIVEGRYTLTNERQLTNEPLSPCAEAELIAVIPSGILISCNDSQPPNNPNGIAVNKGFCGNFADTKSAHSANACCPSVVREAGIVILVKPLSQKHQGPIVVKVAGRITSRKEKHSSKHPHTFATVPDCSSVTP
jgi:hypothetical protein